MEKNEIKELSLNSWDGFEGHSVKFLEPLTFLEGIVLLVRNIEDLKVILKLDQLKAIYNSGNDTIGIDYSVLKNLVRLSVNWHEGIKSILDCRGLEVLRLSGYKGKTFESFSNLVNLRSLDITARSIETMSGISMLTSLSKLSMSYMTKLASLDDIDSLRGLRWLHIQSSSKISDIRPLSELVDLEVLAFDGCGDVQSLAPIANLKNLRYVSFFGTTKIVDGDLTPLLGLPLLRDVMFEDRRNYSHRREVFPRSSAIWSLDEC